MPIHDWTTKFIRAWMAGFASQIVLLNIVGYGLVLFPPPDHAHRIGSLLLVMSEISVVPSAIYTALVAAICVTLTDNLKWSVITSAAVSFATMALLFMASSGNFAHI